MRGGLEETRRILVASIAFKILGLEYSWIYRLFVLGHDCYLPVPTAALTRV